MKHVAPMLLLLVLTGCVTPLPYQPKDASVTGVSADYALYATYLQVELNTVGQQVEKAELVTSGGQVVPAREIQRPAEAQAQPLPSASIPAPGVSGLGSARLGPAVATGFGSTAPQGNTIVWFARRLIGDGPWTLRVRLAGREPIEIDLPVDESKDHH